MNQYAWKEGAHLRLNPQVAGEHIESLGACVTPDMIVRDARHEMSPLHPAFEWNDTAAAEKWRESQAREILRMLVVNVVVDDKPPVSIRAYWAMAHDESTARVYTPVITVLQDVDLRKQLVSRCAAEMRQLINRYNGVEELAGLFADIEQAMQMRLPDS